MRPHTHYTQEPSSLSTDSERAFTRVRGGGFVTREMLEQALQDLHRGGQWLPTMMVDLRDVAGYEASCLHPATQFLHDAATLGLTRIALVASSSVMRTASKVVASALSVELRAFEHEPHAAEWLQGSALI